VGVANDYSATSTYTVIVARTGRVVERKAFTFPAQACPSQWGGGDINAYIPVYGDNFGGGNITAWINGFLTGPPR
jgi:hypothetical protein